MHDLVIVMSAVGPFARRHASAVALVVLVSSVLGTVAAIAAARVFVDTPHADSGDLVYVACQVLPFGVVGAVLVERRPDLPFGWLLSLAAMGLVVMLAIAGGSMAALEHGRGGELAVWGLTAGTLMFVPVAIEGLVNVRFPSGSATSRWGRILDRAIVGGIVFALVGGVVGDATVRAIYPDGALGGADRFIDGTPVVAIGNLTAAAVPVVILLGVLAGVGVVVRYVTSEGVERCQLKWRAIGVVGALALFPFAVTESLPDVVSDVEPLLFVATLVVPVLRYDLWAIDSIIRRSAISAFGAPGTVVDNMVRASADMLHLPYVAVRHGDRILASYGQPSDAVETWPLAHEDHLVGDLIAAPASERTRSPTRTVRSWPPWPNSSAAPSVPRR